MSADGIIENQDIENLVEDYCGGSKETVRAYLGYLGRIRKSKRTGEGYLVRELRKGYLERYGFMSRVNRHQWRVNQTVLFPVSSLQDSNDEGLVQNVSIKNSTFA